MCYRPLHLFNPVLEHTTRDKVFIDVPCGQCAECRKRKQSDWFVRCFYQYLETTELFNGIVLYITLTYDNAHLPTFFDYTENERYNVFSKRDIQLFMKLYRKKFRETFGADKSDLKYFIVSEYGGDTHRSHYHGCLFLPHIHPNEISNISMAKHLVVDCWRNGFVSFGKKRDYVKINGVVENANVLAYVCKYITKDFNFPYDKVPRERQPFHLQSRGFGEYMIRKLGLNSSSSFALACLIDGSVIVRNSEDVPIRQYPYAIPQYITRKVLYDYEYHSEEVEINGKTIRIPHVKYTLNDVGKEVKKSQEFHSVEYQIAEFNNVLGNFHNIILNTPNGFSYLCDHSSLCLGINRFCSLEEFEDWLNDNFLAKDDFFKHTFALYTRLFKDRVVIPHSQYFKCDPKYQLNDAMLYLDEIYDNERPINFLNCGEYLDYNIKSNREFLASQTYAYTLNPENYIAYEQILELFNVCTYLIGIENENRQNAKQEIYDNAKVEIHEGFLSSYEL